MHEHVGLTLSDVQMQEFQAQGFLRLGRISPDDEISWLRNAYDTIVQWRTGYCLEELQQMSPEDMRAVPVVWGSVLESLVTIVSPEKMVPDLLNTCFFRQARRVVATLLGGSEAQLRSGWRIFCKPAHGGETPWHQDAIYRPPPHCTVSIWMPLDPATDETSCLHYLGGSHLGELRPHQLHDDHMVAQQIDPSPAVACPIAAGEALVHHCRTLHYAGPNRTPYPRRALVIVSQLADSSQTVRSG